MRTCGDSTTETSSGAWWRWGNLSDDWKGDAVARMKLRNLVPVLDVRDVDASIEFYCGVLGFTLHDKLEWGGKTEWALLRADSVQLMLSASQDSDNEELPQKAEGMFFLYHDNLDSLLVYLGSRGYDATPDLLSASGIKRDFYLRDPDGYVLWFTHKPPAVEEAAVRQNGQLPF